MTDSQDAKRVVLDHYARLDAAGPDEAAAVLADTHAPGFLWRGMHPWDTLHGAEAVAEAFWAPLKRAMGPLQRRPDIFAAGTNDEDGGESVWVVQMGHLMGLWDAPFLELGPSRKIAFFRYVEFHRVADGLIQETASFCDVLGFVLQAGYEPLPPMTGARIVAPGPRTHDGLLLDAHDPAEGQKTSRLIHDMVADLTGGGVTSPAGHLDRFWTKDMCWFGPAGIGASAFREGYRRGHTGPFEAGLEFVRYHGHQAHLAEGRYGGFFGYPSLTMRPTGGYMGLPASEREAEMRIVDMYRREEGLLAENWIFIDMLHFLHMQGLDVLARLRDVPR